jgi:hypothetical protein
MYYAIRGSKGHDKDSNRESSLYIGGDGSRAVAKDASACLFRNCMPAWLVPLAAADENKFQMQTKGEQNAMLFSIIFKNKLDLDYTPGNFLLTYDDIIFWNQNEVWRWRSPFNKNDVINIKKINIKIKSDEFSHIMQVKQGNDPQQVCIQVKQGPKMQMILVWDLQKDIELQSFDSPLDSFMMFDEKGNCYIANEKKQNLTVTEQGVTLKSYPIS